MASSSSASPLLSTSPTNRLGALVLHCSIRCGSSPTTATAPSDMPLLPPLPPFVDCMQHLLLNFGYHFIDDGKLYVHRRGAPNGTFHAVYDLPMPNPDTAFDACLLPNGNWIVTGGAFGAKIWLLGTEPDEKTPQSTTTTDLKVLDVLPSPEDEEKTSSMLPLTVCNIHKPTSFSIAEGGNAATSSDDLAAVIDRKLTCVHVLSSRDRRLSERTRISVSASSSPTELAFNCWTGALAIMSDDEHGSSILTIVRDCLTTNAAPTTSVFLVRTMRNKDQQDDWSACVWVGPTRLLVLSSSFIQELDFDQEQQQENADGNDDDDDVGMKKKKRDAAVTIVRRWDNGLDGIGPNPLFKKNVVSCHIQHDDESVEEDAAGEEKSFSLDSEDTTDDDDLDSEAAFDTWELRAPQLESTTETEWEFTVGCTQGLVKLFVPRSGGEFINPPRLRDGDETSWDDGRVGEAPGKRCRAQALYRAEGPEGIYGIGRYLQ